MSTKIEDILRDIRVSLNEVYEDGYRVGKADQRIEDIERIDKSYDSGAEAGYTRGEEVGYRKGKKGD
jgi:DNA repair ATPase RecN